MERTQLRPAKFPSFLARLRVSLQVHDILACPLFSCLGSKTPFLASKLKHDTFTISKLYETPYSFVKKF